MEKSGVREWFTYLKESLLGDMRGVTGAAFVKASECALRFVAAFILANAQVFGAWRPFAVAMVAASGTGLEGFFALMGATLGLILLGGMTDGIKHVAVCFLVAAVSFVLRELSFAKKRAFPSVLAGVMTALIGFVFLLDQGISPMGLILFIGEAAAVAGCTYLFQAALEDGGGLVRKTGLLLLAAGLVAALSPLKIMGVISVGRLVAGFAVLAAATAGGWSMGAAIGVAAGAAVDFSAGDMPFFTLAFGLGGLTAGLLAGPKRYPAAFGYLITLGACLLWQIRLAPAAALFEAFGDCAVFMLLPDSLLPKSEKRKSEGKTAAKLAARRLSDTAAVFAELFESVTAALSPENVGSITIGSAFDRTAERVCKRCQMNHVCWQRDGEDTRSALNDASAKFTKRGVAEAADFPQWFASRCRSMPKFVSVLNEELVALDYRRRYEKQTREDKRIVASQYGELSKILTRAASMAALQPGTDMRLTKKLNRYLRTLAIDAELGVYRDGCGRLNVELEGVSAVEAESLREGLSSVVQTALDKPRQLATGVIFTEKERFTPKVGVAAKCRREEMASGDYGTWFRDGDGRLFLILSDGRGSGPDAEVESHSAVRVLEKLLRAGAEPESAVKTLDSAYTLRGGGGGYATVDLFAIDLFTGDCTVIKWGAAPTYIKSDNGIHRLGQPSPPPGTGCEYEKNQLRLKPGDLVVMCSDGLCDRDDDGWVMNLMEKFDGKSPRELAAQLAAVAEQTRGNDDDITVMAVSIC